MLNGAPRTLYSAMPKNRNAWKSEMKKLDIVFSRWLRMSMSDEGGRCACVTCGTKKHWKEMQAGHFQSRSKMSTRWLVPNVLPQCARCNLFHQGEQYAFAQYLDRTFGEGTADSLLVQSNTTRKYSVAELRQMRQHYEDLVKALE